MCDVMDEQKINLAFQEIKEILQQINGNTKTSDQEVWHKPRSEIDGEKVTVYVRVNVITVGDIDNVKQEFSAELYLIVSWKEPALKGKIREDVDWEDQWDPRIIFANAVSMDKITKKHHLDYDDGDEIPNARIAYRLTGTFKEKLELQKFPFDYQELSLLLMSDWPSDDVELVKDMEIKDSIRIDTFTASQEWDLCNHIIARSLLVSKEAASSHRTYPRYMLTMHIVRKPGYYLWNVALIVALIMLLTFTSLAVEPSSPADRLSVTLTLLLTSVAFKFVVSQSLPCISYLTLLDVYVIMCMIVQFLMATQNAIASLFPVESDRLFDIITAAIIGGAVILIHIIMGIVIAVWTSKRNSFLHRVGKDYFTLCDGINRAWLEKQQKTKTDTAAVSTTTNETPSKKKRKRTKSSKNRVNDQGDSFNSGDMPLINRQDTRSGNRVILGSNALNT